MDSVWRSRPGVVLQGPTKGAPKPVGLAHATLGLGRFKWGDRTDGIYYLQLVVTANNMRKPAEFEVALEPSV